LSLISSASACGLLLFAACATTPSRAPLGGTYAFVEPSASVAPKPAATTPAVTANDDAGASEPAPRATPSASAAPSAVAATPPEDTSTLRYDPLRVGERVHDDVELALNAQVEGVPSDFGGGAVRIDAKLKIDVKISKASAQELEELEVTFTPLSVHSEFNGQGTDTPQEPPSVYDVIASGSSPKITPRSGKLEKEDRVSMLMFVAPLLEFHRRWAASPTLVPSAGYHASIPVSAPSYMLDANDTTKLGPLTVRYDGPRAPERTPFALGLPLEVSSDFGKIGLDLQGKAELGPRARPVSLELSGPCTGSLGPGTGLTLRGDSRIHAKLSYD